MNAYQDRTEAARPGLKVAGADAAVLFPGPNQYYVSDSQEEPGERQLPGVLPRESHPAFVASMMYCRQIAETTRGPPSRRRRRRVGTQERLLLEHP